MKLRLAFLLALITTPALAVPAAVAPQSVSVYTRDETALRAGNAWSVSTGLQSTTAGTYLELFISNASSSTYRHIINIRTLGCDNPTGTVAAKWTTINNPTVNLPTTALTVGNRKTGAGNTIAMSAYIGTNVAAASLIDTSPSTPAATRIGGMVPTGGVEGGPGEVMRTLEPGQSTAIAILSVSNGLTTTPVCSITVAGNQESMQ